MRKKEIDRFVGGRDGERERFFDSEQKLLLQHWLEICNQVKSGKYFEYKIYIETLES
jgi:hypothetical protein